MKIDYFFLCIIVHFCFSNGNFKAYRDDDSSYDNYGSKDKYSSYDDYDYNYRKKRQYNYQAETEVKVLPTPTVIAQVPFESKIRS